MGRSYIKDKLLAAYLPSKQTEITFSKMVDDINWYDDFENIDFFISYSSRDKLLVKQFTEFLMDQISDCSVYAYAFDAKAVKNSSDVSLDRIEKFLEKAKIVFFLQSDDSIKSYWCAWELGYISAIDPTKCIIVRVNSDDSFTKHREYLRAYPRLMISKSSKNKFAKNGFALFVLRPDDKVGTPLVSYLSGFRKFLKVDWEEAMDTFVK